MIDLLDDTLSIDYYLFVFNIDVLNQKNLKHMSRQETKPRCQNRSQACCKLSIKVKFNHATKE